MIIVAVNFKTKDLNKIKKRQVSNITKTSRHRDCVQMFLVNTSKSSIFIHIYELQK